MTLSSSNDRLLPQPSSEPVTLEMGDFTRDEALELELRFTSSLQMTAIVGPLINRFSSLAGFDDAASYEVELCTIEAITNSIEHSCERASGHEIRVAFRLAADRLQIRVCDTAPAALLSPGDQRTDLDSNELHVPDLQGLRGRGLFIMTQLMETVCFESSSSGKWCNTVTMERPFKAPSCS